MALFRKDRGCCAIRKSKSQKIALCGVLGALSVVLMLLGNVLQIGTYCAPMLACFLLIPIQVEYGNRYALLLYAGVALLSMMLVPDKELALFYVMVLGYYPVLKTALEKLKNPILRWVAKLLVFNGTVALMYLLLIFVFAPPGLLADFADAGTPLLAVLLALGNLCFWLCDRSLTVLTRLYKVKLRKKLGRMF